MVRQLPRLLLQHQVSAHTPNHCYTQIQAAIHPQACGPGSVCHSSVRPGCVHADTIENQDCPWDFFCPGLWSHWSALGWRAARAAHDQMLHLSLSTWPSTCVRWRPVLTEPTAQSWTQRLGSSVSCIVSCLWSTCVPRECYYAHFLFTPVFTSVTPMVVIYGKTSFWKALLHEFNIGLDEYPCLSLVPGQKPETSSAVKCKNWKVDALLCLCDILV